MNNTSNRGLGPMYNALNDVYDNGLYSSSGMSRADFIALAGITAVYVGASRQYCMAMGLSSGCTPPTYLNLTARYGREDCPTSPVTDAELTFPDPHGDLEHVLNYFAAYGLTTVQTVALIGAHSLGDTNPENSGFIGPWTSPRDSLDNKFFKALIDPPGIDWFQVSVNSSQSPVAPLQRYQWVVENITAMGGPPRIMMLNTDIVSDNSEKAIVSYLFTLAGWEKKLGGDY